MPSPFLTNLHPQCHSSSSIIIIHEQLDIKGICPLSATEKKLSDVHRLWHQADSAYFDPNTFILTVRDAIKSLREVIFLLGREISIIKNIKSCFGDPKKNMPRAWQRRMEVDPLMRWVIDGRNEIEMQGDLEANSMVRAEIVASSLVDGPRIEVPAYLSDTIPTLLNNIPDSALGQHVRRNGMLRIQRRWIENTLPDYEVLDAVAIAYEKITALVADAHRQIGLNPPLTIHVGDSKKYNFSSIGWRPPCMVVHEFPRTLLVSLPDDGDERRTGGT